MSYEVKQGNIFGRIGTELGKGLSESIPKEVERNRLSAGLKELNEQKDLSPQEYFTRALSVPGLIDRPQAIQSLAELAKQQGMRNAYKKNAAENKIPRAERNQGFNNENFAGISPKNERQAIPSKSERNQDELVSASQRGQPQVVNTNPLREETKTVGRRTPEEKIEAIARLGEMFPQATYPELNAMADEEEARRMAQPEAANAEDERLRGVRDRLRSGFQSLLEKKLQKQGPATFADISGEMQNNLIRGMERDLAEHPGASEDDVINTWTQKALDLAKAKKGLESKANSSLFATPILLNKQGFRRTLEDFGDIYRKAGNSEEFYNDLQSYYGFSPMGAASLAYPPKKEVKEYISKSPKGNILRPEKNAEYARKAAIEIEDKLSAGDSILSIARNFLTRDPTFDINSFYNQLSEDKDSLGLTSRQRRELTESGQFLKSNWADILILPLI